MAQIRFVDYSGAAPILLPVSIMHLWNGFYLPADPKDGPTDLELPNGSFNICDDFDFANPKTDYNRARALGGIPSVQTISVGSGHGLIFATELDSLTWWPEKQMLVNGGSLPLGDNFHRVTWSDTLTWQTAETDFILMNACDHGADPGKQNYFDVRLVPGEYQIQRGDYGWEDDDPAMVLFRFVDSH